MITDNHFFICLMSWIRVIFCNFPLKLYNVLVILFNGNYSQYSFRCFYFYLTTCCMFPVGCGEGNGSFRVPVRGSGMNHNASFR